MARTRNLLSNVAIENAIKQGMSSLIDREAEQKAFMVDIAQNANNPAKLAEIVRDRENRLANAVEVFGQTHVKVLNRVIRAFDVGMSNAEKLRIVKGFIDANGGATKVAGLVNNAESAKAARIASKKQAVNVLGVK